MINPAKLLGLKNSWNIFTKNHPKFPKFLEAVHKGGVEEGTIIEIKVVNTAGKELSSNLKLKKGDIKLYNDLTELFNQ